MLFIVCSTLIYRKYTYDCGHLSRDDGLTGRQTHLLYERILQRQVIPPIDEQLILEMLRRVEVLAWWLFPVTPTLEPKTENRQ